VKRYGYFVLTYNSYQIKNSGIQSHFGKEKTGLLELRRRENKTKTVKNPWSKCSSDSTYNSSGYSTPSKR